jgi:DNA-binding response OmpR family regulator
VTIRPGTVRVLVVDSDEAVCALLKDAIESEMSLRVSTASNGPAAHAALQEDAIDLVLVEGRLPGAPGTPAIAAHADKLRIPVIFMASDPTEVRPKRGVVRGVLGKPFRMEDLAYLVAATLRIARRRGRVLAGPYGGNPGTLH